MIFHVLLQKTSLVVSSKDTDAIVLMVFTHVFNKINEKWLMKIEVNKFINIRKIWNISELTLQQSILKFMQLQVVTQLLFYMLLENVFKNCLYRKAQTSKPK